VEGFMIPLTVGVVSLAVTVGAGLISIGRAVGKMQGQVDRAEKDVSRIGLKQDALERHCGDQQIMVASRLASIETGIRGMSSALDRIEKQRR
jgi:SMC interacting uncharacterized protein involved in chromosome segregation